MEIFLNLVKEFFEIEKGVAILEPDQKIKMLEINNISINITKKSIKHYTESRKEQLHRFTKNEQLNIIIDIANNVFKVLIEPDKIYDSPKRENSLIYIKKYHHNTII